MNRVIWKGAISFGLVHIPVAMYSATSSHDINFDWLDERSLQPIGYKRINKITGKEVSKENIVKGIQLEKGRYIVLSDEEIRAAHPLATQTIDIFAFIDKAEIPLAHIETPYYLTPDRRGNKVYTLLEMTLRETNKVALTNVVVHTRQYLGALMSIESTLVLLLLRWPEEMRSLPGADLPDFHQEIQFTKGETEMAKRLVQEMTSTWNPKEYQDTFQKKIMDLVDKKARKGQIKNVESDEAGAVRKSADVIDLTELLKRSLRGKPGKKPTKSDNSVRAKVTSIRSSNEKSKLSDTVKSKNERKSPNS